MSKIAQIVLAETKFAIALAKKITKTA